MMGLKLLATYLCLFFISLNGLRRHLKDFQNNNSTIFGEYAYFLAYTLLSLILIGLWLELEVLFVNVRRWIKQRLIYYTAKFILWRIKRKYKIK